VRSSYRLTYCQPFSRAAATIQRAHLFSLPLGHKTDIRADTCEAPPLKTHTCKALMRHGNHGNTKGEKFTIGIYNVYSLCLNRDCALTAQVTSATMYIYYRSHIYNYLQVSLAGKSVVEAEFPQYGLD